MPLDMSTINAIIREHLMPDIKAQLYLGAAERRIYFERKYGMPPIMPRIDWWPWMTRMAVRRNRVRQYIFELKEDWDMWKDRHGR